MEDAVTEIDDEVGVDKEEAAEPVRRLPLFDAKVRGRICTTRTMHMLMAVTIPHSSST